MSGFYNEEELKELGLKSFGKNVLVFPCGSEIGLEIVKSLRKTIHFKIFGASSVDDHGRFVCKNYIENVPYVEDENFIKKINEIVKKHKIDFIFPAHDSVVLKLAQNQDYIDAKIITSPVITCEIARSKRKTYETLKNVVLTPKIYDINSVNQYPVFLKPDVGQGSQGCLKVNSKDELISAIKRDPSLLILEYLPGKEYTIDCFTNQSGELLYAQGRERARISKGISVNSKFINKAVFSELANKINKKLHFRGVWFFQVKENINGDLSLLEIAPRVAGTMALSRLKGVNLPLMSLFDFSGTNVNIINNNYNVEIDRALENKFRLSLNFDEIYVDFDDCLIINNEINTSLVSFLYQALNQNKKIILLSKHDGDIESALKKCRLKDIFDEIIHLKKNDNKYKYIKNTRAIFIDDSFAERKEIKEKIGINVFAPDMIENLEVINE